MINIRVQLTKNHLILLCLLVLSACTHITRKDGPPNFPVDETRIPNALPKAEAHSKYGNPHSYAVFGKRYYTLRSSKNYEAVGVASWYGTKFHKQRTSSGEPYDMLAMTAAHKTLPLPTYAQVINLHNHRSIVVKINDRGPFAGNRLIDLSYVAAKKLGVTGHGTALVKVKAIDPIAYWNQATAVPANVIAENTPRKKSVILHALKNSSKAVYVQVGAFRNRMHAERLKNRLIHYITAPVKIAFSPHVAKNLYRVQIGPIMDPATVKRIHYRLKQIGLIGSTLAMSR